KVERDQTSSGKFREVKMQTFRFKTNYYRQALVIALIALVAFTSMPSWSLSGRATAYSSIEDEIAKAFDELGDYLAKLPHTILTDAQRGSLGGKIKEAKGAFVQSNICEGAKALEAFADEAQSLRQGARSSVAEDLRNRGWSLRQDILALIPKGKTCDDSARFNREPVVKLGESDNRHLIGSVSFGEPKMWSVTAAGELFSELGIPGISPGVAAPR